MHIAIVSTYPPRPCGIAMFSSDLRDAMVATDPSAVVDVVSIVRDLSASRAPEVVATIRQEESGDYPAAARALTRAGVEVVLIEHEYGIFGGDAGSDVVTFADALTMPYVVTLHTVLSEPSPAQDATLRALCERASLVAVFTETAARIVTRSGLVDPDRIRVLAHGAPEVLSAAAWAPRSSAKADDPHVAVLEQLRGRAVLSTFGLISPSKGIELAIRALPAIVAEHPEVLYLVAGQTHPEVIKHDGEEYRLQLKRLVDDLQLGRHVQFIDRFLSIEELGVLLSRTDLYVTPYRSREQIVSGALTFAVAAGCPVVSTPYLYAEDLLGTGAGTLVPFGDPSALAAAVVALLDSPAALAAARSEARRVGAGLTWASVGKSTLGMLTDASLERSEIRRSASRSLRAAPELNPGHVLALVDDVGIVQHARGNVADRSSGYCLDDAARLVIAALGLRQRSTERAWEKALASSLSFVFHAWDPSVPGMHNLMGYDRRWEDRPHSGDHVGRAAWALGVASADESLPAARPSLRLLDEMIPCLIAARSPRQVAFTILGLCRPRADLLPASLVLLLRDLADRLAEWYDASQHDGWRWFEESLSYDNARLPQALIAAGRRLEDPALGQRGLQALDWYADECSLDTGVVRLVGNHWRRAGDELRPYGDEGDEQPLEASALVEAMVEAWVSTGHPKYADRALTAYEWFLGRNRLGAVVYDPATGGCHDGLGLEMLNDNEGAESTLAYLQARLALETTGSRPA